MRKISFLILISVLVAFQTLVAQEVKVFATTDTTEYIVGDYIDYTLELNYAKGINVVIPMVKDSLENLVFIKNGEIIQKEEGNKIYELRHFIFSKYDSSDVTIPSFYIPYTIDGGEPQFAYVNPVDIVVHTIDVNQQAEIQDVKDPKRIPLDWLLIAIISLLVLALLVASYYGYKYYQKKKSGKVISKPEIIIPLYDRTISKLNELSEQKLWQQGFVKEFHSEVTGIVRDYFEERFNFLAMEMTSKEIISNLYELEVEAEVIKVTEEFLTNADMVKFAKFQPMPTVNENMMEEAYSIVNATKEEKFVKSDDEVVNAG